MKSNSILFYTALFTFFFSIMSFGQESIDSLSWSTDGEVKVVKIDGNSAYVGGYFNNIGKKVGNAAFFDADKNLPDYHMPIIGNIYGSFYYDEVMAAEPDGTGGWFVGGNYDYVNGNTIYSLVHVLADKTVDPLFHIEFTSGSNVYALKRDGDYLYIGGNFVVDIEGVKFYDLIRYDLKQHKVDKSWQPLSQISVEVTRLEISSVAVFISGTMKVIGEYQQNCLAAVDKITGKRIDFPASKKMSAMKLVDGILWVAHDNGGGYGNISNGLSILSKNNTKPGASISLSAIYASIPDGKGGYYLLGDLRGKNGIHHVNEKLEKDETFIQDKIGGTYYQAELLLDGDVLYVAANYTLNLDNGKSIKYLFKLNAKTGQVDESFIVNPDSEIRSMCLVGDKLYIGGDIETVAGEARNAVAAIDKNTGALLSWNPEIYADNYNAGYTGPDKIVSDIQVYGNYLYVAGTFQTQPDLTQMRKGNFSLARYNISTGVQDANFMIHNNYYDHPLIDKMGFKGNKMYILGDDIMYSDGTKDGKFAVVDLDNPSIEKFNSDIDFTLSVSWSSTNAEMIFDGNRLYITDLNAKNVTLAKEQNYIVCLDTETKQLADWTPAPDYRVHTLSIDGENVLVGGQFFYFQWSGSNSVIGIDVNTLEYRKVFNSTQILDIDATSNAIFFAGNQAKVNDIEVNGLIKVNRQTLEVMTFDHKITNAGARTYFGDIAIDGDKLYAVPYWPYNFNLVGDVSRNNICCINTETAELLPWDPAPFNGKPSLVFAYNNKVIVSGPLGLCENHKVTSLAKINLETKELSDWNPVLTGSYITINDMFIDGDHLYVGGAGIGKVNGVVAGDLCAIDKNGGGLIESFACHDYYGDVHSLSKLGDNIFVKGSFSKIDNNDQFYLCKVNAKTGALSNWKTELQKSWTNLYDIETSSKGLFVSGSTFNFGDDNKAKVMRFNLETGAAEKYYAFNQKIVKLGKNAENRIFGGTDTYTNGLVEILDDTIVSGMLQQQMYNGVSNLASVGNLMFVGGNRYKEFDKWGNNSLVQIFDPALDSTIYNIPMNLFYKNEGSIQALDSDGKILAVGGQFSKAGDNIQVGDVAFYTLPDLNFPVELISVSPKKSANEGMLGVSVKGRGFKEGTVIKLVLGSNTLIPDSTKIKGSILIGYFNLNKVEVGKYDVVVEIPGAETLKKESAIEIQSTAKAEVWAELIGPSDVMYRRPTTYYLNFGNNGNEHAYGTLIFLGVNEDQNIEWSRQPEIETGWEKWKDGADFFEANAFFGHSFKGKVYPLLVPYIPGGSSHTIRFTLTSESQAGIRLAVIPSVLDKSPELLNELGAQLILKSALTNNSETSINGKYADKLWSYSKCMYGIAGIVADLTPGVSCVKAILENIIVLGIDKWMSGEELTIYDGVGAVGNTVLGCAPVAGELRAAYKLMKQLTEGGLVLKDCAELLQDQIDIYVDVFVFFSKDPNAKYGPLGNASSKYVQSKNRYSYMITYENVDSAMLAAQKVAIIDTIDTQVFDLSTFKPMAFGFGDTTLLYPEDAVGKTIDVDLRPTKNIIVRVEHKLDMETGILTWLFSTLNPETMLLTEDLFGGFLPPNKKAPEGEGNVLFTIMPKAGIEDRATIQNKATIIFDWNDPILTNNWVNLVDNAAPVSSVNTLPSETTSSNFEVSWAGSDETSGIYAYDIYVSENDSAYYKWLNTTETTSAIFSGQNGVRYSFYSVAIDSAGNREEAPAIFDASTLIIANGVERENNLSDDLLSLKVFPNPANDMLQVSFYLPFASEVFVSIVNECGVTVQKKVTQPYYMGKSNLNFDISDLPLGFYFMKISCKEFTMKQKFVVGR